MTEHPKVTPLLAWTLIAFAAATVMLIPLEAFVPGLIAWALALFLAYRTGEPIVRRNFGLLLGCVLVLGFAPINTTLNNTHFLAIGVPFIAVVLLPYIYLRWRSPESVDLGFWPRRFSLRDIVYTVISIPLAWSILWVYFFYLTPEMPTHWSMPAQHDPVAVGYLTFGINFVGIWDELFFINTCYVLLRAIYPARIANLGQAVVYTSVLYHMAFTGAGPFIVYVFALTQGAMYEKSRVLFYVLIVHLIVDALLVLAILQHYYPDQVINLFLMH